MRFYDQLLQEAQPVYVAPIDIAQIPEQISKMLPAAQEALIRPNEPPIKYPLEELGEILGAAAIAIHEGVQAPAAICAQSILACISYLSQPHVNLIIDGRVSPSSEYFFTIADSGDRKSATDKIITEPIRIFQREKWKEYCKKKKMYDEEKLIYDAAIRKQKNKSSFEIMPVAPEKPVPPIMLIEEPTYEGIVKLYEAGCSSFGLFSEEGGRIIGGHALNKDNILKTIAGFSSIWDGTDISKVRAGEDANLLPGRRLSIHLLVQPFIANMVFGNPAFVGMGFLARVLCWHPESLAGTRFYKKIDVSKAPEVQKFYGYTNQILKMSYPLNKDIPGELEPRNIPLSNKAHEIYREFHDEVEKQLLPGGDLIEIKSLASKAAEHAARLALNLHFFHVPVLREVSEIWMKRACVLMRAYLNEAKRIWNVAPVEVEISEAEQVQQWIRNKWVPTKGTKITGRELRQYGPSFIRTKSKVLSVSKVLIDSGHFKPLNSGNSLEKMLWEFVL